MKSTLAVIVFFIILVAIYPFVHFDAPQKDKTAVMASNFALYDLAHTLLKEDVSTGMLLKVGSDLHSFEPTPKDMVRIKQSDFFIYSALGGEHYLENLEGNNLVDVSEKLTLLTHKGITNDEEHHGNIDPHYWLDIDNMITLSNYLSSLFSARYPQFSKKIAARNQAHIRKLEQLKAAYKKTLATCKLETIVVNHNAYSYLAKAFGFKVESLSGLSSDAQSSAKVMARLSHKIKEQGIGVLFYDPFENHSSLEALAKESNATVTSLNTLANVTKVQYDKHASYITLMQENLEKLRSAMVCQ